MDNKSGEMSSQGGTDRESRRTLQLPSQLRVEVHGRRGRQDASSSLASGKQGESECA